VVCRLVGSGSGSSNIRKREENVLWENSHQLEIYILQVISPICFLERLLLVLWTCTQLTPNEGNSTPRTAMEGYWRGGVGACLDNHVELKATYTQQRTRAGKHGENMETCTNNKAYLGNRGFRDASWALIKRATI
jgi:hypothetical protein